MITTDPYGTIVHDEAFAAGTPISSYWDTTSYPNWTVDSSLGLTNPGGGYGHSKILKQSVALPTGAATIRIYTTYTSGVGPRAYPVMEVGPGIYAAGIVRFGDALTIFGNTVTDTDPTQIQEPGNNENITPSLFAYLNGQPIMVELQTMETDGGTGRECYVRWFAASDTAHSIFCEEFHVSGATAGYAKAGVGAYGPGSNNNAGASRVQVLTHVQGVTLNVLCVGDSIIYGYYATDTSSDLTLNHHPFERRLPCEIARLRQCAAIRVPRVGLAGFSVSEVLDSIQQNPPAGIVGATVFLTMGMNDASDNGPGWANHEVAATDFLATDGANRKSVLTLAADLLSQGALSVYINGPTFAILSGSVNDNPGLHHVTQASDDRLRAYNNGLPGAVVAFANPHIHVGALLHDGFQANQNKLLGVSPSVPPSSGWAIDNKVHPVAIGHAYIAQQIGIATTPAAPTIPITYSLSLSGGLMLNSTITL